MRALVSDDAERGALCSPAPPRKRIRFPAEIILIGSSRGCDPLEHTRRRMGRIPLRTTLSQIPLKSFGFPGAESARKRFFLRGQAPVLKKSAPGATNRNLRFRLVGREATCLPFGQATFPTRRSSASIGSREGSHPLALSRACSDGDFGFRRSRLFFCGRCFRRRERGALRSPTSPRGTGARGLRPSRALPGLDWREIWFLMEQGTVLAWRI